MADLFTAENLVAFLTLTLLEIILGIDNLVFIAIVAERVEEGRRRLVRRLGLALALVGRVALLFSIGWVLSLTKPIFTLPFRLPGAHYGGEGAGHGESAAETAGPAGEAAAAFAGHPVSVQDLVLLLGGGFLLWKATHEIHKLIEGERHEGDEAGAASHASVTSAVLQILALDLVFSIDSVITAVGMAKEIWVMVAAVVAAVAVMLLFSEAIAGFVRRHPAMKMLCLAFLTLIGGSLLLEAGHIEVPRGYIYAAIGFSLLVEVLQMRQSKGVGAKRVDPLPRVRKG